MTKLQDLEEDNSILETYNRILKSFLGIVFALLVATSALDVYLYNHQQVTVYTKEPDRLSEIKLEMKINLLEAKASRERAPIDAETRVIKAKADAEANTLLENSIKDKSLFKLGVSSQFVVPYGAIPGTATQILCKDTNGGLFVCN